MAVTAERQAELQAEIDALDKDRETLNQTLLDTGKKVQDLEASLDAAERRLDALVGQETKLRTSLASRRDVLAEVLAALQRMGRRPPPAILVRPEDALASVRSAILLGAVVPGLRSAADKIAGDLRALVAVKSEIEAEKGRLSTDAKSLGEEQTRVKLLLDAKNEERNSSAQALADEQARAAQLADQATSLKDLIAKMESQIAAAAAASAAAAKSTEELGEGGRGARPSSLGRADRLAPAVAFADARGLLPMPVVGTVSKHFGDPDGLGGRTEGMTVLTRAGAQVNAPSDGWVVYAGPFRSYGQLLIINAGGGYHVLLAGMERIDVQLGQFVLAGEPVAVMASQRLASAGAVAIGATQPVLYIEFRKDGASIDPAPWWAASNDEKVGG
jgi:septal ring factor EnvC (AmiA/AmiB activator)